MPLQVYEGGPASRIPGLTTSTGSVRNMELICIDCGGSGEITEAQHEQNQRAMAMWCRCGNPTRRTRFYEDGEAPDIHKHHVKCGDCGKVLQVG
jgi:Fe2+ or Zn2+ uptake regulation protein